MNAFDLTVKEIEEALMADERTQDANIEVTNERGIVTLNGMVEALDIAMAAEEIVRNQSGVVKVVNSLQVEGGGGSLEAASPNPKWPPY